VTENDFEAKILEPGKLIPATSMRAIVNVAVPAARGQYWIDMRLIPIFGKGYGVKTFRACTDVSSEL
jgi:predicted transcriptional regulator